jgi:ketosteroid isomerase-like protein
MTDTDAVQRWLDAYSYAWESYDPDEIGALFSEDAEYRLHPWDEGDDVIRGRQAIVDAWLRQPDPRGTYVGRYRPLVVEGDSAVTTGTSRYYTDATRTTLDREYHNLFVLRFAEDGRCRSFTEWFMRVPGRAG